MNKYNCIRCKKSPYKGLKKKYSKINAEWLKEYRKAIEMDAEIYTIICTRCLIKLYTIRKEGKLNEDIESVKKSNIQKPHSHTHAQTHMKIRNHSK